MGRIIMVVTMWLVMAAMMVATTAPAFAAKGGNGGGAVHSEEDNATCTVKGTTQPCDIKVVQTPCGNLNATVHGHPPEGGAPEGGNGGGAVNTDLSGTCTAEGGTQPCEGKAVQTPSGNLNATVHGHPSQGTE
jgi:type 1 fimbria pilin